LVHVADDLLKSVNAVISDVKVAKIQRVQIKVLLIKNVMLAGKLVNIRNFKA